MAIADDRQVLKVINFGGKPPAIFIAKINWRV